MTDEKLVSLSDKNLGALCRRYLINARAAAKGSTALSSFRMMHNSITEMRDLLEAKAREAAQNRNIADHARYSRLETVFSESVHHLGVTLDHLEGKNDPCV